MMHPKPVIVKINHNPEAIKQHIPEIETRDRIVIIWTSIECPHRFSKANGRR